MNVNDLLERGYKEFKPQTEYRAMRGFQKCVEDIKGNKLYFLTVFVFSHIEYETYELHTQFYQKDTHYPLDMNFFDGWTLDDIEKYASDIYAMNENTYFEPYEKKEEK